MLLQARLKSVGGDLYVFAATKAFQRGFPLG
jgi:hypothetical protein